MKNSRFVAALHYGGHDGYINIPADKMCVENEFLRVFCGTELVALIDMGVILSAQISAEGGAVRV